MTHAEPTLAAPMPPSSIDFAQVFAAEAERSARIDALRPANRDRMFDGLTAAGITHVTVTFDGEGDSGQIESIGAWTGDKAVDFPAVEIPYAALTWENPEVEMRQQPALMIVVNHLFHSNFFRRRWVQCDVDAQGRRRN
jgi:hypothetical protein